MRRRLFLGLGLAVAFAGAAFAAPATTYSSEAWKSAVSSGKPVLVHVHATWCPTCKAQTPILDKITGQAEFKDLIFIKVDFDKDVDFRKQYGVGQQSTIIVFKGGKEVARSIGVTAEDSLLTVVKTAL